MATRFVTCIRRNKTSRIVGIGVIFLDKYDVEHPQFYNAAAVFKFQDKEENLAYIDLHGKRQEINRGRYRFEIRSDKRNVEVRAEKNGSDFFINENDELVKTLPNCPDSQHIRDE